MNEAVNPFWCFKQSWKYAVESAHLISKNSNLENLRCIKTKISSEDLNSGVPYVICISELQDYAFTKPENYQHLLLGFLYGSLNCPPKTADAHFYVPKDFESSNCTDIYADIPNLASSSLDSSNDSENLLISILLQHCAHLLKTHKHLDLVCNSFFKVIASSFMLLSKFSQEIFCIFHLRWGVANLDALFDLEYVLFMILLHIPTITSISNTDLTTIAIYSYIICSDDDIFDRLYVNLLKETNTQNVMLKFMNISLLVLRSTQWLRIDGLFLETASVSEVSNHTIYARKFAIKLLLKMWFYTAPSELHNSSHLLNSNLSESSDNTSSIKHFFRTIASVWLGRDLVFALADVGRMTELKSLLETLLEPSEAIVRNVINKVQKLKLCNIEDHFEKLLYHSAIVQSNLNVLEAQCMFLDNNFTTLCTFDGVPDVFEKLNPTLLICLLTHKANYIIQSIPARIDMAITLDFFKNHINDNHLKQFSWNYDTRKTLESYLIIPDVISYLLNSSDKTENSSGWSDKEILEQLLLTSQYSILSPPGTLQSRCFRSCVVEPFFLHFNMFVHVLYSVEAGSLKVMDLKEEFEKCPKVDRDSVQSLLKEQKEVYLSVTEETASYLFSFPKWCMMSIIRQVCYSVSDLGIAAAVCVAEASPFLLLDLMSSWLQKMCSNSSNNGIECLLISSLAYISNFVKVYYNQIGVSFIVSTVLGFAHYTVMQLFSKGLLPHFEKNVFEKFLEDPLDPALFGAYYESICVNTLVGQLLILCGFEPQMMFIHRDDLPNRSLLPSDRKSLLQSNLIFDSVLIKFFDQNAHIVPLFTDINVPLSNQLFQILINAFNMVYKELPLLYPLENFLSSTCV